MRATSFITPAALLLAIILLSGVASADSSCTALFDNLRKTAAAQPTRNYIHVLWTTNYYVPERDARFMATTRLNLILGHGDLAGSAERSQLVVASDPAKPPTFRRDHVSLRLRADGRLMLNDRYGPFDPVCSHNKFAIVNSSDSIEVFSFNPVNVGLNIIATGDQVTITPPNPGGGGSPPGGPNPGFWNGGPPRNDKEWCAEGAVDGQERFYVNHAGEKFKCPGRIVVADEKVAKQMRGYSAAHAYFTGRVIHVRGALRDHDLLRFVITVENWADPKTCEVFVQMHGGGLATRWVAQDDYFFLDTVHSLAKMAARRWHLAYEFSKCKDGLLERMPK